MRRSSFFALIIFITITITAMGQNAGTNQQPAPSGEKPSVAAPDMPAAGATEKQEPKKKLLSKEQPRSDAGVFTLGEIVVKDRAIATIEDASTTTEVTARDIERRSDRVLADSLRMVPGLQVVQHQKGNQEFELRGYAMDRVALLIDGIPITDAYGGNMDIDNIGVENLSKIIITRGASSALYGARSAVGTINMVTQKPEKLFGRVGVEYGQYNNGAINVSQGGSPHPLTGPKATRHPGL
jgi:outer membrane cobalamin receptor